MDFGKCRNTFFDEHDTYVRTEQVSISLPAFERCTPGLNDLIHWFDSCQLPGKKEEKIIYKTDDPDNYPTLRLYLKNSAFRI